jgi:7-carboxy-7-deazaguanine synthase
MKLNLVNNGIFPIVKDINNNYINNKLDTGFEFAGTVQGEGKLNGVPSLFIRTSGCNLRCLWLNTDGNTNTCDTAYSSFKPEKNQMEIDDIITIINNNSHPNIQHVIISGGEPTMQTDQLGELLIKLKLNHYHTTIETNGTIISDDILFNTDLFSISPKLSNSNPTIESALKHGYKLSNTLVEKHANERINIDVIQEIISKCNFIPKHHLDVYFDKFPFGKQDFQLKFVITKEQDIEEIQDDFLSKLKGWKPSDILLMPEGITWEEQRIKNNWVVKQCIKNGYRWCPRLHVLIWDSTLRGI